MGTIGRVWREIGFADFHVRPKVREEFLLGGVAVNKIHKAALPLVDFHVRSK